MRSRQSSTRRRCNRLPRGARRRLVVPGTAGAPVRLRVSRRCPRNVPVGDLIDGGLRPALSAARGRRLWMIDGDRGAASTLARYPEARLTDAGLVGVSIRPSGCATTRRSRTPTSTFQALGRSAWCWVRGAGAVVIRNIPSGGARRRCSPRSATAANLRLLVAGEVGLIIAAGSCWSRGGASRRGAFRQGGGCPRRDAGVLVVAASGLVAAHRHRRGRPAAAAGVAKANRPRRGTS